VKGSYLEGECPQCGEAVGVWVDLRLSLHHDERGRRLEPSVYLSDGAGKYVLSLPHECR